MVLSHAYASYVLILMSQSAFSYFISSAQITKKMFNSSSIVLYIESYLQRITLIVWFTFALLVVEMRVNSRIPNVEHENQKGNFGSWIIYT